VYVDSSVFFYFILPVAVTFAIVPFIATTIAEVDSTAKPSGCGFHSFKLGLFMWQLKDSDDSSAKQVLQ